MPVSNTYVEPTSGTTLNLARQQLNDSMRAVLTNFKGPNIPTNLKADDVLFTDQQDGMLFRSAVTNALYISDSVNKQAGNIGGNFTRWGIGTRVEPTVASLTSRATLANFYETGEVVVTLDTGRLYVKNGTTNTFGSFVDVGNPVGYTVGTLSNITFSGESVRAPRFLADSNVGINNLTPSAALHVVGTANITGAFTGNVITSTSYRTSSTAYSATSWTTVGPALHVPTRTYTDTSTASSTSLANRTSFSLFRPTYAASATNITIANMSTLYIEGNPTAGTNITGANSYAVLIDQGKMHVVLGGTPTTPAMSVRSSNTGLFSTATTSLGVSVLGNTAATFNNLGNFTATTLTGNVSTSNLTFTGTSVMRGDFNTTSGVTTTAAINSVVGNAYTPSPVGGNMKTLVNDNSSTAITFNAPTATGDYTLVVQVTNGTAPGAITLTGFTKTQGSGFTLTTGHIFLVFITKIGSNTFANVVALQ
jgi:hypothetical protein